MDKVCESCKCRFEQSGMVGQLCIECDTNKQFKDFAASCGLRFYPCPNGERYLYAVDGKLNCKKSERIDFMDGLWNALVKVKNGPATLLIE